MADYNQYSITAPADSRLPGGGGYVLSGLYDLSAAAFGRTDNFVTESKNFGDSTNYWHGVDVHANMRLASGLTLQGGTSTGRRVSDQCAIADVLPEAGLFTGAPDAATPALATNTTAMPKSRCRVSLPFTTDYRGLAAYTIPKLDVQVSATWQSRPGPELVANWNVPNAVVQQSLGRPLSGSRANVTVNLLEPGQMYGDRVSQIDMRVAKILRFGKTRSDDWSGHRQSDELEHDAGLQRHVRGDLAPADLVHAGEVPKVTGQFNF